MSSSVINLIYVLHGFFKVNFGINFWNISVLEYCIRLDCGIIEKIIFACEIEK